MKDLQIINVEKALEEKKVMQKIFTGEEMSNSPTTIPAARTPPPHRPDETTTRQPMVFLRFSQTLSSSFLYIGLLLLPGRVNPIQI